MRVLRIDDGVAEVEVDGNVMSTDISLLEEVQVGDYVIIHAGIAIQKYDQEEAEKTLELIREIAALEGP
jgi:hydrogenase expression/formation protein HypC